MKIEETQSFFIMKKQSKSIPDLIWWNTTIQSKNDDHAMIWSDQIETSFDLINSTHGDYEETKPFLIKNQIVMKSDV